MNRPTWTELVIDDLSPAEKRDWFAPWVPIFGEAMKPIFLNRFGCWFLESPTRRIEMLDVFSGSLVRIAEDAEAFARDASEAWWHELYLRSDLIGPWRRAGVRAEREQCYAINLPPDLGGPNPAKGDAVDLRHVAIVEMGVWQERCADRLRVASRALE